MSVLYPQQAPHIIHAVTAYFCGIVTGRQFETRSDSSVIYSASLSMVLNAAGLWGLAQSHHSWDPADVPPVTREVFLFLFHGKYHLTLNYTFIFTWVHICSILSLAVHFLAFKIPKKQREKKTITARVYTILSQKS